MKTKRGLLEKDMVYGIHTRKNTNTKNNRLFAQYENYESAII